MREDQLLDIFEKIDEELILEAAPGNKPLKKKVKNKTWIKWGAMAAGICLIIGTLSPTFYGMFRRKGSFDLQEGLIDVPALLYFQGALYECCDTAEALKQAGLPSEITSEMAGEHVAYIEYADKFDYQTTVKQTDKELFEYAPSPISAVYVLRDGENYMAALFCRTYLSDDVNAYCHLAEVYRFFGISSASDILSIAHTDWNKRNVIGAEITEANAIKEFYTLTTDIKNFVSLDNDGFQSIVFDGIPEEKQQDAHSAFADDLKVFRVKTKDGLCFYLYYYPSYGYLYSGQAMSYHQVTTELAAWFKKYFSIIK